MSRAGCADQLITDHVLSALAQAALLHSGRPTVVTVGVGAQALGQATRAQSPAEPAIPVRLELTP
ncbi:MAG: hypothetical protein ACKOJ7_05640 [Betaproteobacteria bacterium]